MITRQKALFTGMLFLLLFAAACATILHLLGLDHTKLTYRFQGRDFRLTDVRRARW